MTPVPELYVAEQEVPQLMRESEEVTVPEPVFWTERVKVWITAEEIEVEPPVTNEVPSTETVPENVFAPVVPAGGVIL